MIAVPSVGPDFRGVRVEVHPSQSVHFDAIRRAVPGASVTIAHDAPGYGVRVYPVTVGGNCALGFFWDAGWRSIQAALTAIGANSSWID